jgi:hypothetical protein
MMRGYSVTDDRVFLVREQFGSEFQNFAVLDDVAIEACKNFGIAIGEYIGPIENKELEKLAQQSYFAYAYFTGSI